LEPAAKVGGACGLGASGVRNFGRVQPRGCFVSLKRCSMSDLLRKACQRTSASTLFRRVGDNQSQSGSGPPPPDRRSTRRRSSVPSTMGSSSRHAQPLTRTQMMAANSVSSGVSCVPPTCGRTFDGGISGLPQPDRRHPPRRLRSQRNLEVINVEKTSLAGFCVAGLGV